MDNHKETYRAEAYEILEELETSLLELEETPDDRELIGRVFRAMHTIKGSGAMFGFDDVASFTHEVETVFDSVRSGRINVTNKLVDLTLKARDQIRLMIEGVAVAGDVKENIVGSLRMILKGCEPPKKTESLTLEPEKSVNSFQSRATYRILFKPHMDVFATGANPLLLIKELLELGEGRVHARTESIPDLKTMDPEACYLHWDIVLTTDKGINSIRDVFIFIEDDCDLDIRIIDEGITADDEPFDKKLGEILVEKGVLAEPDLRSALGSQSRIGKILVDSGVVSEAEVALALAEQEHVKNARKKEKEQQAAASIRVPSERLDKLVDLVGEMVTLQARLSQTASRMENAEMISLVEEAEKLTAELRDNTMSIRMVPIGTTFSRYKRLVRDLSNDLGKDVNFITEGGETELDKTIVELLFDPAVHIIRNCMDHGIELPDERISKGKKKQGIIKLSAMHSGANVLIKFEDDGKGLDSQLIRQKAIEKGLVSAGEDLSEKEIFSFIFAPGFSTSKTVTGLSGRGVGMDVVKRNIESLRGSIDILSKKDMGTTITLSLPLTLAIIDGFLVTIDKDYFVLPLATVEECVELPFEETASAGDRHTLNIRGEMVPYVRLRELFGIISDCHRMESVVITRLHGERVGLVVDEVIGSHQTVIKSLGPALKNAREISGATILGDGTVALILDVNKLL